MISSGINRGVLVPSASLQGSDRVHQPLFPGVSQYHSDSNESSSAACDLTVDDIGDAAVTDLGLDGLEVHGTLDDFAVVGRLRVADGVVEDVAVAVLHDAGVDEDDGLLEALIGDGAAGGARSWRALGAG